MRPYVSASTFFLYEFFNEKFFQSFCSQSFVTLILKYPPKKVPFTFSGAHILDFWNTSFVSHFSVNNKMQKEFLC